jgi:hypothetical protein
MVVIDAGAHSEHVQIIRCDFKLGSVERSKRSGRRGRQLFQFPSTNENWKFQMPLPIKIEKILNGLSSYRILTGINIV